MDEFNIFKKINNHSKDKCNLCHSSKFENDYQQGITYCQDCGTHRDSNIISLKPEWKNSSDNTFNRCNCIIDPLLSKMSMSTRLIGVPRHISLVHCWHTLYSYKEHSLSKVFRKMEKVAQENNIPLAVLKYAQNLYKIVSNKDLKRGNSRIGIMGACIYYGCRVKNIVMHEKDVAKIFDINIKYLSNGCDILAEYLFDLGMDSEKVLTPFNIFDHVEEFCLLLNTGKKFKKKALNVAAVVESHSKNLKNMPFSLAAGCIYFVAVEYKKVDISLLKIAMKEKCDLSDVTITKCYNNFAPIRSVLLKTIKEVD